MRQILLLVLVISMMSCQPSYNEWTQESVIELGKVGPIGIDADGNQIWVSDGNNNQLLKMDIEGNILSVLDSFDRPMHIAIMDGIIYVPEYGSDNIQIINGEHRSVLEVQNELDAPAGIDVSGQHIAIADFYSNSIHVKTGSLWNVIGEKGSQDGAFHYPTDVQILNDTLYIADAYNHRVQVITLQGEFIRNIGADQDMSAATGVFVTSSEIFVTDLENDRVLIFDHKGEILQILENGFDKPTDLMVHDDKLFVLNYGYGTILVLSR